ncbi:MAG: trypsin-like peptidase domain-containing protein [Candidatus Pacearchaeota archaeon]|jgi:S1-C subfamily serine protease
MPVGNNKKVIVRPIVHHHIVLKPHHKWIIGGVGTLVVILLITLSIFSYASYVREEYNYNLLNKKIADLSTETQGNVNELSSSILKTQESLSSLNIDVGNITTQFSQLKASVGSDFSSIIEQEVPSVVTIKTDAAQGTGFIITSNGYIVTNAHVLADQNGNLATGIKAITSNQQVISANFVGYDPDLDIALLKIPGNYSKLTLGNSNNVQVGEEVIAIGNPLGLQFSVSQGIISAVNRQGQNGFNYYFQTDTALNPGNSGGPLIDKNGNVIGINNFKASGSENIGFALESNYIKQAVDNISMTSLNTNLL